MGDRPDVSSILRLEASFGIGMRCFADGHHTQLTGVWDAERWHGRVGLGLRRDFLRCIARFLELGGDGVDVSPTTTTTTTLP